MTSTGTPFPSRFDLSDRLTKAQIELRTLTSADAQEFLEVVAGSQPELARWMPWAHGSLPELLDYQETIEGWQTLFDLGREAVYGIFAADRLIGGCGLHEGDSTGEFKIGYWVATPETRQGVATAVVTALLHIAFQSDLADLVLIQIDRNNLLSQRIPTRLGFVRVEDAAGERHADEQAGIYTQWVMTRERWTAMIT